MIPKEKCPKCETPRDDARWPWAIRLISTSEEIERLDVEYGMAIAPALSGFKHWEVLDIVCIRCGYQWRAPTADHGT